AGPMRTSMQLGRLIADYFGAPNDVFGCRELVWRHAPELRETRAAVDVFELGRSLGLTIQSVTTAKFEGRFRWDESGAEGIDLAGIGSEQRQRFTLAHEIGHWMLRQFLTSP